MESNRSPEPADGTYRCLLSQDEFDVTYRRWVERAAASIKEFCDLERAECRWALIGIKSRGAVLAQRLWNDLSGTIQLPGDQKLLYGQVDISLYRDDFHLQTSQPKVLGTEIDFPVDGVSILLVDDVLYTGRTVRAAMDLILDFGRPRVIQLGVFVDRGHRELPIMANVVGTEITTEREDRVLVRLREVDEEDSVLLVEGTSGT